MPYVRQKGKGWQYTVNVGIDPATGARIQKSKGGFKSDKLAYKAGVLLEEEIANGLYTSDKGMTFEELKDEWFEMYRTSGKVKISSVRIREYESNKLLPFFAKLKVKDITKKMYQSAINKLHEEGLAHITLSGIQSTGKMIFKRAMEKDIIKVDPTQYSYIPKTQKSVEEIEAEEEAVKYLEKEELALLLKTAATKGGPQDYVIFMLLSYTGMRLGELISLKWRDVDFEEGVISITKTCYNPKGKIKDYKLIPPKTMKSKRKIEIDLFVVQELKNHMHWQKEIKMANRKRYHDEGFVIARTDAEFAGYPEIAKAIQVKMRRFMKSAGLNPSLTPHSLRHTHTSLLAEARVDLQEIMDRLGHKDDNTTRNVYLHVTKTKKKEAAQKFSDLMSEI
ncbi:tyrosine-type recombinase/integrase [Paenibacillus sp. FSL M7-1414]|uniref:tyrosine-type recombinase/integrase n=1 Tax=Paenibacillus sp. FSL M7-1414 TaxID=2921542 RepID=UPI0030FCBC07